ncbi:NAD-dependent epimerase/dehydratase family protein [Paraglaciecola sp. L3A3]|uniref:NAD-dependent epimerase/dehydratase family protein n=1 Tax=Paraglaciecola sp. L3A3 TaxID=2686358 RepID=UPI00131A65BD|nr:NAD-dependent epimerase/dehydratase family protein [Paraglaciecola sp. L3A3]
MLLFLGIITPTYYMDVDIINMQTSNNSRAQVIIIGAGAITQQWHLPILMGRSDFNVVGVVDKSPQTTKLIEKAYPELNVYSDVSDIDTSSYSCAIVATPVAFHYAITKDLLQKNKHVLVEKPIAFSHKEAEELVLLAESKELILSVSLYRRLYPSLSLLKNIIDNNTWGAVKSFCFNWGDFYSWSASSLGNMKKELAGGGVLMDLGPHALDWLCYLFGEKIKLLSYKDDALSGIETDCQLQLEFESPERTIEGSLMLSRIRSLGGDLIIYCDNATLRLSVGERFKVKIEPLSKSQSPRADVVVEYEAANALDVKEEWFETFAKEHDDFVHAINNSQPAKLSGRSVLPAAKIIDECYQSKAQQSFTWSQTNLFDVPGLTDINSIFITGASGFVGGRLVEVLAENTDITIYAGVNNPNNATRISRYNVNMVQFDLNDAEQLTRVLNGCDAVVHCAVGTAYGDNDLIYRTTVNGTQNLLTACKQNNIKKIIHLSSLAVINMENNGKEITEQNCQPSTSQNIYAKSKLDAENLALNFAKTENLQLTILRPTTIYGPFSPLFKVGAGKQAINNGVVLTNSSAKSPSNSVYIDNVISAILQVLANNSTIDDSVFFVNDDDSMTYEHFYGYFTEQFNQKLALTNNHPGNNHSTEVGTFKLLLSELKGILTSKELRKLALKLYNTEKIGFPLRWTVSKFPAFEDKLRDSNGLVFKQKSKINASQVQIDASTDSLVSMRLFKNSYPLYTYIDRDKALSLTADWVKFSSTRT